MNELGTMPLETGKKAAFERLRAKEQATSPQVGGA